MLRAALLLSAAHALKIAYVGDSIPFGFTNSDGARDVELCYVNGDRSDERPTLVLQELLGATHEVADLTINGRCVQGSFITPGGTNLSLAESQPWQCLTGGRSHTSGLPEGCQVGDIEMGSSVQTPVPACPDSPPWDMIIMHLGNIDTYTIGWNRTTCPMTTANVSADLSGPLSSLLRPATLWTVVSYRLFAPLTSPGPTPTLVHR